MKHYAKILGTLAATVLLMQTPAFSQTDCTIPVTWPAISASIISNGNTKGDLELGWTESGLTPGGSIRYVLSAFSDVTYNCVNSDGTLNTTSPSSGPVTRGVTLTANKKGTISQKGLLDEAEYAGNCPVGTTALMFYVKWTNIQIIDVTDSVDYPTDYCADIFGGSAATKVDVQFCKDTSPSKCPPPT